jgi:hypothetical protein
MFRKLLQLISNPPLPGQPRPSMSDTTNAKVTNAAKMLAPVHPNRNQSRQAAGRLGSRSVKSPTVRRNAHQRSLAHAPTRSANRAAQVRDGRHWSSDCSGIAAAYQCVLRQRSRRGSGQRSFNRSATKAAHNVQIYAPRQDAY